ncbi:hypothetical protein JAAARDRAFT_34840 [Jaapia argillacea MUCL 33604]|uniref:Aminopeptidase P N-terminal domain-containing protein n=1 Tax=Jaapia argillacea MUCL 33604 TaxID=933084 RepID=A0A067Q603_9AGAM|nr:hypothetical protein JAAARDRAFT_34840 [Jaapia argillacea MUCL 33604]
MSSEFPVKEHTLKTLTKLVSLLPAEDQQRPQVIFLAGGVTPYRNDTDRELPFRQESNFYYLTGCPVPSSLLLITSTPPYSSLTTTLFIPPIEPADLMWSVPPPTLEQAAAIFNVDNVLPTTSLSATLSSIIQSNPNAIIHTLPLDPPTSSLFPTLPPTLTSFKNSLQDAYLLPALHKARLIKTPYEIAQIRKANEISSRAHEVVMRVLGAAVKGHLKQSGGGSAVKLPGEWLIENEAEAEAIFVASCRREGATHQAYLPIVAASTRASTLHYCCNDKAFAWGPIGVHDHKNHGGFRHSNVDASAVKEGRELEAQVLLIDAGCEWGCYASDITRTMPVGNGGKFSTEARAIYELVLEMQQESLKQIKPGVHWDTIQLLCHKILVRGFQKLGIFLGGGGKGSGSWNSEEAILASGISAAFFPHGVGHSLGLDVHDVPSASKPLVNETIGKDGGDKNGEGHVDFYKYLRLRIPLEENMVLTVEPGIYFHTHLLSTIRSSPLIDHKVLERYEGVGGVRIEDVVRVSGEGAENLTGVGSGVRWVEGVCGGL